MNENRLNTYNVMLSNGAQVPLAFAATILSLFDAFLAGGPKERELAVHLREACLSGKVLTGHFRNEAAKLGLSDAAGAVLPDARKVILAAVHGEGEALFTVTPFTHPMDRAVSDLLTSRQKIEAGLPPHQVAELLADSEKLNSESKKWVKRHGKKPKGDLGFPPSSMN